MEDFGFFGSTQEPFYKTQPIQQAQTPEGGSGFQSFFGTLGAFATDAIGLYSSVDKAIQGTKDSSKQTVTTTAAKPATNYTPWIIGGIAGLVGLGALVIIAK